MSHSAPLLSHRFVGKPRIIAHRTLLPRVSSSSELDLREPIKHALFQRPSYLLARAIRKPSTPSLSQGDYFPIAPREVPDAGTKPCAETKPRAQTKPGVEAKIVDCRRHAPWDHRCSLSAADSWMGESPPRKPPIHRRQQSDPRPAHRPLRRARERRNPRSLPDGRARYALQVPIGGDPDLQIQ